MHAALDAFARAVQREPAGRSPSTWLALSTLRKRALSSAFALQRSVERRLIGMDASEGALQQLTLPLFGGAEEISNADDVPAWTIPPLRDAGRERDLLARVANAAVKAIGQESKLMAIGRLLRRIQEPIIVFTEYRDTLAHVCEQVVPGATMLHGAQTWEERRAGLARFRQGGVLLATDAAGEGLNLHHGCRVVINLELPWNPMRLEQRIGRIDRIGQARRVHAFHLIASGTAEVRVLQRLGERVARAQQDVGAFDPLGDNQPRVNNEELFSTALEREAEQEHQRLIVARRLMSESGAPDETWPVLKSHPLVTYSKRRGVRAALGDRALILFRSVLSTQDGQEIASFLTPVALRLADSRRCVFGELNGIADRLLPDPEHDGWLASSRASHALFWAARLNRERSLQDLVALAPITQLQPGLFDRRADQAWTAAAADRREAIAAAARQVMLAERAASSVPGTPQVALVLFTR